MAYQTETELSLSVLQQLRQGGKKPWKLTAADLGYLLKDIQRSGYRLTKPIKAVVTSLLNDYSKGHVDPQKHFPQAGTYVGAVRLLNLVLHAHGLPTVTSLEDPLIKPLHKEN